MLFGINSSFRKYKLSEVRELLDNLNSYYDFDCKELTKLNFYINKGGKVFISSVPEKDLETVNRISGLGMYFATVHDGGRVRLSVEGCNLIKPKKNYIVLNEKGFKAFISGEDLFEEEIAENHYNGDAPFIIVVYDNQRIGVVSKKEKSYITYLPKSRKLDFNKVF